MKNFLVGLVVLGVFVATSSIFVVQEGERGIVFQFSKIQRTADGAIRVFEPGMHFKLPLVETVRKLDARV